MRSTLCSFVFLFVVACGGGKPLGEPCAPDVCAEGLQCINRHQTTVTTNGKAYCESYSVFEICTKRCTTNADCVAVGGTCKSADSCGGAANLCDN